MPKKELDLATFDNKSLDGLLFCRKVYALLDQVRNAPDGPAMLRRRSKKLEKRLIEELIPLSRYVQARYHEGRRIRVCWSAGSQKYDAILRSSGEKVERGIAAQENFVEITSSMHRNYHLARRQLHEQGITFGPKTILLDKKTREIHSEPYGFTNDERATDLAAHVLERLEDKAGKSYPPGTVLIINCFPGGLLVDDEWEKAIRLVRQAQLHSAFEEVFLVELIRCYSATLKRKQERMESVRSRVVAPSKEAES